MQSSINKSLNIYQNLKNKLTQMFSPFYCTTNKANRNNNLNIEVKGNKRVSDFYK